jgi:hypothetical protein
MDVPEQIWRAAIREKALADEKRLGLGYAFNALLAALDPDDPYDPISTE